VEVVAGLEPLMDEIGRICDQLSESIGARIMPQDIAVLWHRSQLTPRGLELRLNELKAEAALAALEPS
jgi:hypothetical protein